MRELGMPLTINAPIHRHNINNVEAIINYAVELGAGRVEIAHVQYYAWALKNRGALMPTREAFMDAARIVERERERLKGIIVIDSVVPDYYAKFPKPCMGGWGKGIINVTPSGRVLPCHAAESITHLEFDNVRDKSLGDIWLNGSAFQKYRGTEWMKEPCRTCPRREIDYGGCRCQAFALTGDAANTDPACSLSPMHEEWAKVADVESHHDAAGLHLPPPGWRNAEARSCENARFERRLDDDRERTHSKSRLAPSGNRGCGIVFSPSSEKTWHIRDRHRMIRAPSKTTRDRRNREKRDAQVGCRGGPVARAADGCFGSGCRGRQEGFHRSARRATRSALALRTRSARSSTASSAARPARSRASTIRPAMKASGITWDDASFHEYITDPKKKVPGNKMLFPGVKDEIERDDLAAYIESFNADGSSSKRRRSSF